MAKEDRYKNSPWTDERRNFLIEQRSRNIEYQTIAELMTAKFGVPFTKNACVGVGNRLQTAGLIMAHRRTKSMFKAKKREVMVKMFVKPRAPVVVTELDPVPLPVGPIGDFPERGMCRWIHGDPSTPSWQCCGVPAHETNPYCKVHTHMSVNYEATRRFKKSGTSTLSRRV